MLALNLFWLRLLEMFEGEKLLNMLAFKVIRAQQWSKKFPDKQTAWIQKRKDLASRGSKSNAQYLLSSILVYLQYINIDPYVFVDAERLTTADRAHAATVAQYAADEDARVNKQKRAYCEAKECERRQQYFKMEERRREEVNRRCILMIAVLVNVVKLVHPTHAVFPTTKTRVVPMIYMHKHINHLVEILFFGQLPYEIYTIVVRLAKCLRRVTARTFTNGEMRQVQKELLEIGKWFEDYSPLTFRQSVIHDVFVHLATGMLLAGPDYCHR